MKLFENPVLDALTKVHPALPALVWLPICAALYTFGVLRFASDLPYLFMLSSGGFIFWSLIEYATHRFLFHLDLDSPMMNRMVFLMHGNHHLNPNDRYRGMMPIVPGISYGVLIWFSLFILFGLEASLPLTSGIALGYLTYDYLHFSFHHANFPLPLWRRLRQSHLIHHARPDRIYGVSTPLWDLLFSTHRRSDD